MLSSIEAKTFLVLPGEDSPIKTVKQATTTKKIPFEDFLCPGAEVTSV